MDLGRWRLKLGLRRLEGDRDREQTERARMEGVYPNKPGEGESRHVGELQSVERKRCML